MGVFYSVVHCNAHLPSEGSDREEWVFKSLLLFSRIPCFPGAGQRQQPSCVQALDRAVHGKHGSALTWWVQHWRCSVNCAPCNRQNERLIPSTNMHTLLQLWFRLLFRVILYKIKLALEVFCHDYATLQLLSTEIFCTLTFPLVHKADESIYGLSQMTQAGNDNYASC